MDLGSGAYKNSTGGLNPNGGGDLTLQSPTVARAVMLAVHRSTPQTAQAVSNMSDEAVSMMAGALKRVGPAVAASMTNPDSRPTSAPPPRPPPAQLGSAGNMAAGIAATLVATGEAAKWGITGAVNPIGSLSRRAARPIKILAENVTLSAAGAGNVVFSPQEPFEGFRVCVPSGQIALPANSTCLISQLTAGDRLMFESAGSVPANVLRENADTGRIDLPVVSLGEQISFAVAGGTANAEFGAAILGYGSRQRVLPDGAEVLYTRWVPMPVTTVPGSGTGGGLTVMNIAPQRHVVPRRIAFDDGVANFSSLWFQYMNVQDIPQFVGTSAEIPCQLFGELGQDDWTDHDMCQLGGTISIGLRNANANTVQAQGFLLCDVIRLQGEARR